MLPPIAERNAEFSKMSRMEQRVAIAKDVLAQLDLKEIVAKNGSYISIRNSDSLYDLYSASPDGTSNYEELMSDPENKCNVCAIGAAAVVVTNGRALETHYREGDPGLIRSLSSYFQWDEMRTIERMFERPPCRLMYNSSDTKMRAVWQHIIDLDGAVNEYDFVMRWQ